LKAENVLIHRDKYKIADFGFANDESKMESFVGTPLYLAPEIIDMQNKKYNNKVDVWSLGVLVYYILTKDYPFYSEFRMTLMRKIISEKFQIPKKFKKKWKNTELADFFHSCFQKDPKKRLSIEEFLDHHIFKNIKPQYEEQMISIVNDIKNNGKSDEVGCLGN
jgi:serine/threonine protein kinase